jgi:hypothetical protein
MRASDARAANKMAGTDFEKQLVSVLFSTKNETDTNYPGVPA